MSGHSRVAADTGAATQPEEKRVSIASRLPPLLAQLAAYGVVSGLSLAFDLAIFFALTTAAWNATLAGVIGYCGGLVLHYAVSIRFIFDRQATAKTSARLWSEYAVSALMGIGLTAIVIEVSIRLGIAAPMAKGLAVLVSFFAVFFIRRYVVFARGSALSPNAEAR